MYLIPRIIHLKMVEILRNKPNKIHIRLLHLKLQNTVVRKKRDRNTSISIFIFIFMNIAIFIG